MNRPVVLAALMILLTGGAAVLRLARLDSRPVHCDEANQAGKFGLVLAEGRYDYDPYEHHGPSLSFLTLPVARAVGARDLTQLTETHLRLVPAVFGILLVALVWLVRDELGYVATLCAAVLAAISPAMVFYSRYYVQEMLLVFFTFAVMVALWRFARAAAAEPEPRGVNPAAPCAGINPAAPCAGINPAARGTARQAAWLVLLGLSIAMMHASKETCVIALFSMAVAAAVTMPDLRRLGAPRLALSGLVVVLVAAGVSALVFSSFGRSWQDVGQSYTTYWHYLARVSGQGSAGEHVAPVYHYFRVLFAWHRPGGPFWTEGAIGVLAVAGIAAGIWRLGIKPAHVPMARFLAVYTVLMTLVYSAIPYKTPWCALGFLHGMILLAGVGAAALVRLVPGIAGKAVVIALLVAAAGHLAWEAHRASFSHCADPNNPYVYVHTTEDIPRLAERIRQIAAAGPDGTAMHVQVICPDGDYWPLPWYLRDFSRIDWFGGIPHGRAAPLIVTQPKMDKALGEYLYVTPPPGQRSMYVPLLRDGQEWDWRLRPDVPLRAYVRHDLWQAHQNRQ